MRNKIIQEAREWIDTPYQHQAIVKHVGVDCVGLIAGVGINSGAVDIDKEQIRRIWNYGRLPNTEKMGYYMGKYLTQVDDPDIGDIAWIGWRKGRPMHLAILSKYKDRDTIIHSYADVGRVVEHTLTSDWRCKIASYWRYPGLL